jgi:beta-lactamase superfamily II metal-dependent hydrolase
MPRPSAGYVHFFYKKFRVGRVQKTNYSTFEKTLGNENKELIRRGICYTLETQMTIKYISADTAPLYADADTNQKLLDLLWGDQVRLLEAGLFRSKVRARGKFGFVLNSVLGDESLLELYFIDVGQGDGILIRTPDGRHIMIDGGYRRASQPTGKNAADFVDWKFAKDYGLQQIHLDVMMASHNDADHYGGLGDLLDVEQIDELDCQDVRVDAFYHAGVAWWVNPANGKRWLGPTSPDKKFLTQLMGDRPQVLAALEADANPRLQGEWGDFMRKVSATQALDGSATPVRRLSQVDGHVPGFEGGPGRVAIRVLAPFESQVGGQPALHNYGAAASKNTNGNSLLLRLDYKRSRILLTGDLNTASQRELLADYVGNRIEFLCDVSKACHHGSDDVSYEFLSAMRPGVTVISSGDNEGHDHPRPELVAASATTGHLEISGDRIVTPLVYSTELARSINLGKPKRLTLPDPAGDKVIAADQLGAVKIEAQVTKAGDLNPTTVTRRLGGSYIVAGLIYGLVNVRTDGEKILCATLNEKDNTWQIKKVTSRF